MKDEGIDLSSLDLKRDHDGWERAVQSVVEKAWLARRRRLTVGHQLFAWARPVLAIAASVAAVSWAAARASGRATSTPSDSTSALVEWSEGKNLPPMLELLEVLGDHDEHR